MSWIRRLPRWIVDLAEGVLVAVAWFAFMRFALHLNWRPRWIDGYISAGLWLAATIALRRIAPGWMFWVTMLGFPFFQVFGIDSYFQLLPLMVAGFAVAKAGRLPLVVVASVSAVSTAALVAAVSYRLFPDQPRIMFPPSPSEYLVAEALVLGAIVVGATIRRLETTSDSLRESNEELRSLQQALSRQAVVDERARIARELHDVVAHHVSAIVVRAQAADRVADRQPQAPREAVQWIAGEGKQALSAMRSVVQVLRSGAEPDLAPVTTPGTVVLAVREAANRVQAAGRVVTVTAPDRLGPLSTEAGLAITRIAQEALTNALLHSASPTVAVTLTALVDTVTLTVHDDGPPTNVVGRGGNGLAHMRERAAACAGTVDAGPDGAGWTVHATIPRGA